VELVRQGDVQGGLACLLEVLEVCTLSRPPRRLRLTEAVAAGFDDLGHLVSELDADAFQGLAPTLILGRVVQQRGDCLVLRGAGLDDDRGHPEQMAEVRDARALARLSRVELEREIQCACKPLAQRWGGRRVDGAMLIRRLRGRRHTRQLQARHGAGIATAARRRPSIVLLSRLDHRSGSRRPARR